jgi:Na+-transporting NADH:ubiquinone oxidoreductase subunit NqrF
VAIASATGPNCSQTLDVRQSTLENKNCHRLRDHFHAAPQGPIYYIAGPPAMVAGLRKMLVTANIDEDDIRTEDFAG